MNETFPTVDNNNNIEPIMQRSEKERVLEELKTEPLRYVLEIANVTNGEELVDALSRFETKAGFEKVFAKLKSSHDLKEVKIVYTDLNGLVAGRIQGPINANYRQANRTLSIDDVYANTAEIGDFYITILHELTHHLFKGADIASGINIIYAMTDIKNTIAKLPIHNKYRHLYSLVLHNISPEDKKKHYGLSSVNEFISETYSNPAFQDFLRSVELKKQRTALSKTTDLILSVATFNVRTLNREIEEKDAFSAFQKIDLDSLDLLEDFKQNLEAFKS